MKTPLVITLLRIAVIAFLAWIAIDLAPQVVPTLNAVHDGLQQTADSLGKAATDLQNYTEQRRQVLAQQRASSSTPSQPEAMSADLSRVEPFSRIATLVDKHRSGWIKVLGSPYQSSPSVAGVPPGGMDCWRRADVEMTVTWLKDRRPLGIMFAATKGQPYLTAEEIKALQKYFAQFRSLPAASNGLLVISINKDTD
jgi:hypothetical protein